jgi:hypothetical protein
MRHAFVKSVFKSLVRLTKQGRVISSDFTSPPPAKLVLSIPRVLCLRPRGWGYPSIVCRPVKETIHARNVWA